MKLISQDPGFLDLYRCWWRMLVTEFLGDKFQMLVQALSVFVTNDPLSFYVSVGHQYLNLCHYHRKNKQLEVANTTMSPTSLLPISIPYVMLKATQRNLVVFKVSFFGHKHFTNRQAGCLRWESIDIYSQGIDGNELIDIPQFYLSIKSSLGEKRKQEKTTKIEKRIWRQK